MRTEAPRLSAASVLPMPSSDFRAVSPPDIIEHYM